jgi:glycerate dehydrogenase
MKIVVLDGYTVNPGDTPWDSLANLGELVVHERTPPERLLERAAGAEVLITNKTQIRREALSALSAHGQLRGISILATGYDVVDVAYAKERGVWVSNVPAYSTASVAQHTIALLLELTQHVGLHSDSAKSGDWARSYDFSYWKTPLIELEGLTLGIVGFGAIGRRVASIASALGMKIMATPSRRDDTRPADVTTAPLERLLGASDVVTLHCPLTPETARLVRRDNLARMKPSALLVNTARGALVDESDLAWALAEGVIAGAALDVLAVEPPPPEHPLLSAPRCIVTPHQAWTTLAARQRLLAVTVENVRGFSLGTPQNLVG